MNGKENEIGNMVFMIVGVGMWIVGEEFSHWDHKSGQS